MGCQVREPSRPTRFRQNEEVARVRRLHHTPALRPRSTESPCALSILFRPLQLPTVVTVVAWIIGIVIQRWRWTIVDGWRTVVVRGWCIKWRSRIRPCPKSRQCPNHTANRSARTGVTGDRTGDCPECGACDGSGHRVGIKSVAHATIGRWIGCAPSEQNDAEQGRQNKILSVFHVSSLRAPCRGRRWE